MLGVGINGKVVECEHSGSGEKFALKILRDIPKAKREAELHFLASTHPNIVKIYDIYEVLFLVFCFLNVFSEHIQWNSLFAVGYGVYDGRGAFHSNTSGFILFETIHLNLHLILLYKLSEPLK